MGNGWALSSEDVPVEHFKTRKEGLHAANLIVQAANNLGNKATLTVDPRRSSQENQFSS